MSKAAPRVERASGVLAWRALAGQEDVGRVSALIRPDERSFLSFDACRADAYDPLLEAAMAALGRDVFVVIDETDDRALRMYASLGFTVNRRESGYVIPTDPGLPGLGAEVDAPDFDFVPADRVDEDRLRLLDDRLRHDVPGTSGWTWQRRAFHEQTFGTTAFDAETYLVAVERTSGEYAGLARVWNNPRAPRLGLIAVLPAYRRRGLARVLLRRVFAVLHGRGRTEVVAEVDYTNVASTALLHSLGARRTGGSVELIRR